MIVNADAIVIVGKFIKTKDEITLSTIFETVDDLWNTFHIPIVNYNKIDNQVL